MKVHTVHSNLHFLNENFGASHISPSLSQPTVHIVRGWEESVAYKTGFINLQLRKFEVQYFYNGDELYGTLSLKLAEFPHKNLLSLTLGAFAMVQYTSTVYAWYLGQLYAKDGHTVQCTVAFALQPLQALFLCGDSDFFWDSVKYEIIRKS